mmetsp:Transcript_90118/g.263496  ORF Transcript_90118/g.263496 Transcript_90118/m.263496 type:complete len:296 (-) Transcript_90118:255-1142(-)
MRGVTCLGQDHPLLLLLAVMRQEGPVPAGAPDGHPALQLPDGALLLQLGLDRGWRRRSPRTREDPVGSLGHGRAHLISSALLPDAEEPRSREEAGALVEVAEGLEVEEAEAQLLHARPAEVRGGLQGDPDRMRLDRVLRCQADLGNLRPWASKGDHDAQYRGMKAKPHGAQVQLARVAQCARQSKAGQCLHEHLTSRGVEALREDVCVLLVRQARGPQLIDQARQIIEACGAVALEPAFERREVVLRRAEVLEGQGGEVRVCRILLKLRTPVPGFAPGPHGALVLRGAATHPRAL